VSRINIVRSAAATMLRDAEQLSTRERIELYKRVARTLPESDAEALLFTAFLLREADQQHVALIQLFTPEDV
jgi:hypothetical protein